MSAASTAVQPTIYVQKVLTLPQRRRGNHIITKPILDQIPEIAEIEIGLANLFLQHTSAALTINENASPDVLSDLANAMDRIAPEGPFYAHDDEGPDDMPAHVKSSLFGASLTIPIRKGTLALGALMAGHHEILGSDI